MDDVIPMGFNRELRQKEELELATQSCLNNRWPLRCLDVRISIVIHASQSITACVIDTCHITMGKSENDILRADANLVNTCAIPSFLVLCAFV
ncbi:hypothetical protein CEXT_185931 [Caerostris extrusa]|uniref:Uncharacterized protein n=1 Tax=Caerostris extrusa TaxID=172846 RepID=A0AAV4MHK7_CAEEX|nr:hypothetical protein CEXT_185931 [Caerostris extrusa]